MPRLETINELIPQRNSIAFENKTINPRFLFLIEFGYKKVRDGGY
jgi:hypothetical protein